MSKFFTALAFFPKFDVRLYLKAKEILPGAEQIWQADFSTLLRAGWTEKMSADFIAWRKENPPEKCEEILQQKNIKVVTLPDKNYPPLLSQIADPPIALFYRGDWQIPERALAIVGTRKITPYGKQVVWLFSEPLAKNKISIVSGLAFGADREAHEAALSARGHTIAVLGGSVEKDCIYPTAHNYLAEKIIYSDGMIISEYPPGFTPTLYSFPMRNRIIAGISHAILVTEAPEKSGALITAQVALESNREVFCVPHQINIKNGAGGNKLLLAGGAAIVLSAEDLAQNMHWDLEKEKSNTAPENLTETEQKIYSFISEEPRHLDEISRELNLDFRTTTEAISMMEINGVIKNIGNMTYGR